MTRKQLIEFLVETAKEKAHLEYIADKLIESGLVEIEEEPKEFWVVWGAYQACDYCFKSEQEAIDFQNRNKPSVTNRKQLVPVDQCKKFEKMWEELKAWVGESQWTGSHNIMSLVKEKIEKLEKGE